MSEANGVTLSELVKNYVFSSSTRRVIPRYALHYRLALVSGDGHPIRVNLSEFLRGRRFQRRQNRYKFMKGRNAVSEANGVRLSELVKNYVFSNSTRRVIPRSALHYRLPINDAGSVVPIQKKP